MEVIKEVKSSSGYGKPPWIFKGSALYQIHLVKAETARAFIPKEFKYTLGGFFVASYDDSPAGIFDELVVIAGIVWNPPTSCAWAARVLVNSDEACLHGRKFVGLPSQVAKFSKGYFLSYWLGSSYFHKVAHGSSCPIKGLPERIKAIPRQSESKTNGLLNMIGIGTTSNNAKDCMDIQVAEIKGPVVTDICTINVGNTAVARAVPAVNSKKLMGPVIKMSLPSFSGSTEYNPHLLKYSIHIECRIRAVQPAKVAGPSMAPEDDTEQSSVDSITRDIEENQRNLSISVMLSKPILALEFNCLKMQVEAPTVVSSGSKNALKVS